MLTTHTTIYELSYVTARTDAITSNCSTIIFDNAGVTDVYINFNSALQSGTNRCLLKAGKSISFGNNINAIITGLYYITPFDASPCLVNIIKETYQIIF